MSWVKVGETDVHYVEAGGGQPLVFLHGFGSCAEAWHQQLDAFSDRYRVIAYDSVNHGHSSPSPEGSPEPDRADELEGFLAALGIERPVLAGNSMGALTVLRWATRHPGDALALAPSGMGISSPEEEAAGSARRDAMFAPTPADVLFLPAEGGFTKEFPDRRPDDYQRYIRLRSTATRIEASQRPRRPTFTNPGRAELADRVAGIESPMQIIVGEHDWLRGAAERLHSVVAGSRLAVIPGAPHNVYYETATEYNEVVTAFLDDVLAGARR